MKYILTLIGIALILSLWQPWKEAPTTGDWQDQLATPSTAEFDRDFVIVRNVRNFRYNADETIASKDYYDRAYDLTKLKRVWFVTEPFNKIEYAAHTFLSFEFENGDFLAITIEARKTKDQHYNIWSGMLKNYPLIYIAADERDVLLMRANVRKDKVYAYPVNITKEKSKELLLGMLEKMNELAEDPTWYHSMFANCTSSIAKHVNELDPGRVPLLSWELWLTASADKLALESGLLDTDLPIEEARSEYLVSDMSLEIGDIPNYSAIIRR